jgi:hypothetical protein
VDHTALMVLAIVGIALLSAYVPLLGLVAIAWASFVWLGVYAAIVITLTLGFGVARFGPGLWPVLPWRGPPVA